VSQVVRRISTAEKTGKPCRLMETVSGGPRIAPGFDYLDSWHISSLSHLLL
jgi:hypothetical protein